MQFSLRAIEVHSGYAWDFRWITKVLDFAARNGLNAVILHRNDVVDEVVFPGEQYGAPPGACANVYERYNATYRNIYRFSPTRRSRTTLRRDYLRRIVEVAHRRGISIYLENKELNFPDVLLAMHPSVTKNGQVCPTDSFWWKFLETKYRELFQDVPGIAGIITSTGTGESRVSISGNRCTCDTCLNTTADQWHRHVLEVIHRVLASLDKTLVVRDFVFDRRAHERLAAGLDALPADVVAAIKNTPHDYYPTFPENPLIERTTGREKWIEFDAMGQYFGWGIGVATMIEDFRFRLSSASSNGVTGIILRTDWESLDGHTAFDTPNILNLYAGAMLSEDPAVGTDAIYTRWLEEAGAFMDGSPAVARRAAAQWIEGIFSRNWDVVRKSLFMQECVFNDCSMFPVGYKHALWLAEEKNSLKDWLPEKVDSLDANPENLAAILREKEEGYALVKTLRARLGSAPDALKSGFLDDLHGGYRLFELYIRGFRALARLFVLVRLRTAPDEMKITANAFPREIENLTSAEALSEIDAVIEEYGKLYLQTDHPPPIYELLNAERLRCFRDDATAELGVTE